MGNKENLVPFSKGYDPRRNISGKNKGCLSLTTAVKRFLLENSKKGSRVTYGDKLTKAMVFRAIKKSDVLAKEIWDRVDPDESGEPSSDKLKGGLNVFLIGHFLHEIESERVRKEVAGKGLPNQNLLQDTGQKREADIVPQE